MNSRLDDIQAAILRVKLKHLEQWNDRRVQLAGLYNKLLTGLLLALPCEPGYAKHVYHQYVIRSSERDRLLAFLKMRSIAGAIHYPMPVHLQPAFQDLGYERGQFPETERAAAQILSLPLYPEMTDAQVRAVCDAISEFSSDDD